jgi:hypothetical protein
MRGLVTLRHCRLLVVLVTLALSACPFNFKYNVGISPGDALAATE